MIDDKVFLEIKKYIKEIDFEAGKANFLELGEHQVCVRYYGNNIEVNSNINEWVACRSYITPKITNVFGVSKSDDVLIEIQHNTSYSSTSSSIESAELHTQSHMITFFIIKELINSRENDLKELFFKLFKS